MFADEWDSFVVSAHGGSYTQTTAWASLKARTGWRPHHIVVRRNDEIVAGAQLLTRRAAPLVEIAYIQGGPLLARTDAGVFEELHDAIGEAMRFLGLRFVALQAPSVESDITEWLLERGWQLEPNEMFQASTVLVDLEPDLDEILARMKSKTRYNIRKSARKEISVRMGDEGDLPFFHRSLSETAERQGFVPPDLDYFEAAWQLLNWSNHSIQIFVAEYEGKPLSALLAIPFGDTVTYWRGAWSGEEGNRFPNEAMQWEAMQWAKGEGYRYYDLEGLDLRAAQAVLNGEELPDDLVRSISSFKLGFGGDVRIHPPALYQVRNRLLKAVYPRMRRAMQSRDMQALLEGRALAGLRSGEGKSGSAD